MPRLFHASIAALTALLMAAGAHAQTQLKLGTIVPAQAPINQLAMQPWIDAVNKDAQRTVEVKMFAGGSLVRHPAQQIKMVKDGVSELGFLVNGYAPGQFPDDTLIELPLTANNALEASLAMWTLYEQGLLRGYDELKVLAIFATGPNGLHTSVKVTRLEDLKGLSMRTGNTIHAEMIEALGAVAVGGILAPQMAESMSRGVVKGTFNNWTAWTAFRLERVAPFHLELPLGFTVLQISMNEDVWNNLPSAARAAFERHSFTGFVRKLGEIEDAVTEKIRAGVAKNAPESLHKLSKVEEDRWRAQLEPLVTRWANASPDNAERYAAFGRALAKARTGN